MTAQNAPCWYVHDAGRQLDDFEQHHHSHDEAVAEAADRLEELAVDDIDDVLARAELITIRRYPRPCILVTCGHCEELLEDCDYGSTLHFPEQELADDVARLNGWEALLPAGWLCEQCVDSVAGDGDLPDLAPTPGPGQLGLDGSEVA